MIKHSRQYGKLRFCLGIMLPILLVCTMTVAHAEIVVIVNPENSIGEIASEDIKSIYFGQTKNFPAGGAVIPVDNADLQAVFYDRVAGKTVAQLNSYWARLIFTGKANPPRVMPGDAAVVNFVSNNIQAIGYVESTAVTRNVKIIYHVHN